MLFNFYHNLLDVIKQWIDITSATFNSPLQPIKIQVEASTEYAQYSRKINSSAQKYRR